MVQHHWPQQLNHVAKESCYMVSTSLATATHSTQIFVQLKEYLQYLVTNMSIPHINRM